jgi:tetratricopeptide (TPR) repeat protein
VLLLANQTVKQIRVWKDPYSLWQHAVKYSPRDRLAQLNLGITNVNKKNFENAAINFEMLGQLEPDPVNSLAWRGLVYLHLKRYQEALDMHTELRRASGSLPESKVDQNCIQYNIGWISTQLGMLENAVRNFNGVDLKAKLRPSANIWLESLANKAEIAGVPKNREGLPGYCEALIPAMAVQGRLLKRK